MTDLINLLDIRSKGEGRVKGELRFMAWLAGCTPKCEPMGGSSKCFRSSEDRETTVGRNVGGVMGGGL